MKMLVFSDLHQDRDVNAWDPCVEVKEDFDVVVAAGDVHSPLTESLKWLSDRFKGKKVVYVPGNHDFWWDGGEDRYTWFDQLSRARELADVMDVCLLSDDLLKLGDTVFMGGTLWTNFSYGTPGLKHAFALSGRKMMDFKMVRRKSSGKHKYVRGMDLLSMHRETRSFLFEKLAENKGEKTVVVTHHAPHPLSMSNSNHELAFCYVSDLSVFFEDVVPHVWLHGHVHEQKDYRLGNMRVVCNSRGHKEEKSFLTFDSNKVVDL